MFIIRVCWEREWKPEYSLWEIDQPSIIKIRDKKKLTFPLKWSEVCSDQCGNADPPESKSVIVLKKFYFSRLKGFVKAHSEVLPVQFTCHPKCSKIVFFETRTFVILVILSPSYSSFISSSYSVFLFRGSSSAWLGTWFWVRTRLDCITDSHLDVV